MRILLTAIIVIFTLSASAQKFASYVDPFIGTDKSDIKTKWGQYGGTYPGAVMPWGAVQLSPETSAEGYLYSDSSVLYFTCINHNSGYPQGSRGNVRVKFTSGDIQNHSNASLTYRHLNETSQPGYYSVQFNDKSKVEMTVTQRTGIFRYTPNRKVFTVSISDAGKITLADKKTIHVSRDNGLFIFDIPWVKHTEKDGTIFLEFESDKQLNVKCAFSTVDFKGSLNNLKKENSGQKFETIRQKAFQVWDEELNSVQIVEGERNDLVKFYTALYHSYLVPQVVSDVDGRYRGIDGKIHQSAENAYLMFSGWDTFRSLHPLLTLLKPARQSEMLKSLLDIYDQQGQLPYLPMTGYHSIPIIVDSYRKGLTNFDTAKAYEAMRKCLAGNNIPRNDTYKYIADGFLNDSVDESVSVTLDYVYNDWALSVFADITGHTADAEVFRARSYNYRNLFDVQTQFMLPRNSAGFVYNPGEMGYKEADKWSASFFVPHNVQDLINLCGGDSAFVQHLQYAMREGKIIHDNETVLNFPYLFSYAGRPDLTSQRVWQIRNENYLANPGGIPGNDDLGSMSSWFVFAAMGFFPACPGNPEYVLTTPMFSEILIKGKNDFKIKADTEALKGKFGLVKYNGKPLKQSFIDHQQIMASGVLEFTHGKEHNYELYKRPSSLTQSLPDFTVSDIQLRNNDVIPDQENILRFKLSNKGATGTYCAIITDSQKVISSKQIKVKRGGFLNDSIAFRLYNPGRHNLILKGATEQILINVSDAHIPVPLLCNYLSVTPLVRSGSKTKIVYELRNISGKFLSGKMPVYLNDSVASEIPYGLNPGESVTINTELQINKSGFSKVRVGDKVYDVKIYDKNIESSLLDLDFDGSDVFDKSGFGNHGEINGEIKFVDFGGGKAVFTDTASYISFPLSESLDISGESITMSLWIYPMKESSKVDASMHQYSYIDFFTKGDYNVLKVDGSNLSFFAGGWGKNTCDIPLPDNWNNAWQHLAGVRTGKELKIYLNGELKQSVMVSGLIEKTEIPWNLGRNAEMPYSRRFVGMFDNVMIFKEALSDNEINELYKLKR